MIISSKYPDKEGDMYLKIQNLIVMSGKNRKDLTKIVFTFILPEYQNIFF